MSTTRLALLWCLLALTVRGFPSSSVWAQERTRLAITIDDLPAAGSPVPGWSQARVLNSIADVLHAHHVPEAVGFFSGGNMDREPATRAALEAWLTGGYVLGNHTYSHRSADVIDARAFDEDVARNQALISELGASSTYFRYPYLERGDVRKDRRIRRYLSAHAYRIADVSVDFEDWAFSASYGRCSVHHDDASLHALREAYLEYAQRELLYSRDSLRRIAGRDVPLVLLLHANFLTAQMLDALLTAYERAGVQFVSLGEAMDDGIYAQAQTAEHGDGALIGALVRERHLRAGKAVALPRALLRSICTSVARP